MARPRKKIDKKTFESLCRIQCTEEEICSVLDCDDKTLIAWCKEKYGVSFSEVFRQKRKHGKASLRRSGWKMAQTSPAVWIFHAKNYLGMSDNPAPDNREAEMIANEIDNLKGTDDA